MKSEYEALIENCIKLLTPLSQNMLNWRPSSRNWSVADCISHLVHSGNTYLSSIQNSINKHPSSRNVNIQFDKYSLFGKFFIKMMEPPVRIKMKMPKAFSGKTITNKNDLLIDYVSTQKKYIKLLDQVNGIDLTRIKITSPANRFIKFRLNEVFVFTAAHNRRHLWQAKNITKYKNFPQD